MRKKAEKKEWMTTQCKKSRREKSHKFSSVNDDIAITHSIWMLTLNSSFLLFCTAHAPTNDCTSLNYFSPKGILTMYAHFSYGGITSIFDHIKRVVMCKPYPFILHCALLFALFFVFVNWGSRLDQMSPSV